jgi:MFS family permease
VLMAALAVAVAVQSPIVVVIVLTALSSVAGAAERPAAMALLPRLVGEGKLGPANALLHTVQELGVVIGPAIGAVLLTVAATWVAFAVNAGTFLVSALLIWRLRRRPTTAGSAGDEAAASQLKQGFTAVWRTRYVVPPSSRSGWAPRGTATCSPQPGSGAC